MTPPLNALAGQPAPVDLLVKSVQGEVPEQDYQSSCGPLLDYAEPDLPGLRVDSGIDGRSEVTPHYDSMLAKLVAVGGTRAAAAERLRLAVRSLRIEGVQTNQAWLAEILGLPAFDQVLTTCFLSEAFPNGWQPSSETRFERLGAAGAAWFFFEAARHASDRPLDAGQALRLTAPAGRPAICTLQVTDGGTRREVVLSCLGATLVEWRVDEQVFRYAAEQGGRVLSCGPRRYRVRRDGDALSLWCEGQWLRLEVLSALRARAAVSATSLGADDVRAALPGIVTGLLVEAGQTVSAGMPVAILEAMKLVHTLCAPRDGVVASLGVAVGDTIQGGTVLIRLAPRD